MRLRTLIVDDEPLARRRLTRLLERSDEVEIAGECASGSEAVEAIRAERPDIVFLDVQMPGLDGVGVLEEVGPGAVGAVVFVTAYDRYALQAFDLHAVDYLLKPFTDRRFADALERAVSRVRQRAAESLSTSVLSAVEAYRALARDPAPGAIEPDERRDRPAPPESERLMVKSAGRIRFIASAEIDWIEAAGSYVRIHTGERSSLLRASMSAMAERLPEATFVRIHRSTIVNAERVVELRHRDHREMAVVLADGTELKLSRTYRATAGPRLGLPD